MRVPRYFAVRSLSVLCGAVLALAISSHAQNGMVIGGGAQPGNAQEIDSHQADLHMYTDVQRQTTENPAETAAYKAFYNADEPAKKIQMGNAFLQKYPKSYLDEPVNVGLLNAYYANQDWKNVYAAADRALTLNPEDVYVLTTVGWLIPHVYQPSDPDAGKLLDTAEQYSKLAVTLIPKMEKPPHTSADQFAAMKAQSAMRAHSALGLVYFRRGDFEDSIKELQQSTPSTASPDATDLYVLGVDFQNLNRFAEAADAYGRCGEIAGPMQAPCKQNAEAAKSDAADAAKTGAAQSK
jgi:tetratricopeptide (TPR) repeat protein